MKPIYRLILLLVISFSFLHCQKELAFEGAPDPVPVIPEVITPEPVQANLQGNILDENGQPAAGATITVGTKTATTDANGYFRIAEAALDKKTSLVIAEKSGYFKGYRVFGATPGTNQVVIKLVKKTLAGTITASAGGDASLSNGSKITLPANGVIVASSGAAYSGDVNVYAAYIDPSQSDIGIRVPGSFLANDKDGKRVMLTSYGMLAVQLESAAGEKLQIKTGVTATLTTAIPAAALASAPSSISLWSVDETSGIWKEDGTATKQGDKYVGSVSHFSFWNCDVSATSITLTLTLHNSDSLPLVHVPVKITRSGTSGWQTTGWGYTDSLGMVSGIVPPNESLLIEVLDPCGNTVYSQTVAPLTVSTDLGIIIVSNSTPSLLTYKGKLLNCSGMPVTNGYAVISFNNMVRYASVDSAGNFEITFITCAGAPASSDVFGIDQGAQQQSAVASVAVTTPVTNAGNITACGTSSVQFINYTLDGTNYSLTSTAVDSLTGYFSSQGSTFNYVNIRGDQNPAGGNDNIYFRVDNPTGIGTFPLGSLSVQNYFGVNLISPFNVTFTNYANTVGQFYEGNFAGQFTADSLPTVHNINTSFKVRRSF